MSLIEKANQIINTRSEEKEREYGPMTEGMKAATVISEYLNHPQTLIHEDDELGSFKYLYGLKLSRQKYNHKEDNLLDAIAYRIAEINAIIERQGKHPMSPAEFNEIFETAIDNKISFLGDSKIINALTTLDLSGDDIYKIHLGIEISKERLAIIDENDEAQILSILRQIYILDKMNECNS